jgi:general secretion pathway protein N
MKIRLQTDSFRFTWLSVLAILFGLLFLTIAYLPIRWLSPMIAKQTACKVVLSQAYGSIWHGSASIGFSEPQIGQENRCLSPYATTERFSWEGNCHLQDVACHFTVLHHHLKRPLEITFEPKHILFQENEALLPGNLLEGLGSPWNSLHPRGNLKLQWNNLDLKEVPNGLLELQFLEMTSPISPVKPLGSFALKLQLAQEIKLDLITLNGPLILNGKGRMENGVFSFQGEASALPESLDALIGLLSMIGNRDGAIFRLKI